MNTERQTLGLCYYCCCCCYCCRSTAPSPFTGYAFHMVEALIVFANEVLVCFLFPIHMGLHRIYHIFTTVIHEGTVVGQLWLNNVCLIVCLRLTSRLTMSFVWSCQFLQLPLQEYSIAKHCCLLSGKPLAVRIRCMHVRGWSAVELKEGPLQLRDFSQCCNRKPMSQASAMCQSVAV